MINRRVFITSLALGFACPPRASESQQPGKVDRIGVLWPGASPPPGHRMEFRQGLLDSGYVEGQNVAIDLRYAEKAERLHELADEMVRLNVSVIATFGDLSPKMAQKATAAIPIVASTDDFVGAGLVTNLGRPEGNITV